MSLLTLNTLDDRREIWTLLHRLSPSGRVAFLHWACRQVADQHGNGPHPMIDRGMIQQAYRCDRADDRLTTAIFADLWALVGQWNLDPVKAAVELEKWGSRVSRPSPLSSSACARPVSSARNPCST